jgi:hypothetical protein
MALATDGEASSAAVSTDMTKTATNRRMSTSGPVGGADEMALSVLLRNGRDQTRRRGRGRLGEANERDLALRYQAL